MSIHKEPHPLAGKTVTVNHASVNFGNGPHEFVIEDWWDRVSGGSWMNATGNPAAMLYGIRNGASGLPIDNEVVYGKIHGLGEILHVSELPAVPATEHSTEVQGLTDLSDSFILFYIENQIVHHNARNAPQHEVLASDFLDRHNKALIEHLGEEEGRRMIEALATIAEFFIDNVVERVDIEDETEPRFFFFPADTGEQAILESIRMDSKHEGFTVRDSGLSLY